MNTHTRKIKHLIDVKTQLADKYQNQADITSSKPARARFQRKSNSYRRITFQLSRLLKED